MVIDRTALDACAVGLHRDGIEAALQVGVVVVEGEAFVSILAAIPDGEHDGYEIDVDDWSFSLRVVRDASRSEADPARYLHGHRCMVGLGSAIDPRTLNLFRSGGVLVATAERATR